MKTKISSALVILTTFLAIVFLASAQSNQVVKRQITGDSNPALDRLNALTSYLEANHETNALKLFNDYANASGALQDSAEMGVTLHLLAAVREGRTNDAIKLLETRLNSQIVGFAASYRQLPIDQQNWLNLTALADAKRYRAQFPYQQPYKISADAVADAFTLLDKKP